MEKIGIIGAGNIGCAIARGLAAHGGVDPSGIYLSRKKDELLEEHRKAGFQVTDNISIVKQCGIILLSVLPGQAREVILEVRDEIMKGDKLLVSVVSAVCIRELKEWTGDKLRIVRVMPNTAAEFGSSMTCVAGEDEESVELVRDMFEPLGQTMVIKEELMPAATIMGACGIAFFLRFIRAVSQGGIQIGFHAEEASRIAAQTAMGAAELMMKTGNHPEMEIDRVTTPKGITIAGLNEMEHYGLSSAMIKGIVKSYSGISDLK
jgi:pyrroline-5-carboxylate reductase